MTVFVDTSAFFALLDSESEMNPAALSALRTLADRDDVLVTHSYVVVESIALVQRRLGKAAVRAFLQNVAPEIETIWVDETLHSAGVAALLSSPSAISLVDHVSFAVMRERGIRTAFAFDVDFAKAGFTVVP